jgi:hypothetical protein
MKLGKVIPHTITIEPSDNHGFVIKIGCGVFTALSASQMLLDLQEYLKDPEKWETEYNKSRGPSLQQGIGWGRNIADMEAQAEYPARPTNVLVGGSNESI